MRRIYYIFAVVFFLVLSFASGNAEIKTNLEILEQQYFELFNELLSSSSIVDTLCVIERPAPAPDYAWLIEQQLFKSLAGSGVLDSYVNASVDSSMRVVYTPVSQTIAYRKIGKRQLERTVDIQIFCQITNSAKKVQVSELLVRTTRDTVTTKTKQIENVQLPFTIGTRKKSLFATLYEPALVIAVTGLIIYLFYSYRSQ